MSTLIATKFFTETPTGSQGERWKPCTKGRTDPGRMEGGGGGRRGFQSGMDLGQVDQFTDHVT